MFHAIHPLVDERGILQAKIIFRLIADLKLCRLIDLEAIFWMQPLDGRDGVRGDLNRVPGWLLVRQTVPVFDVNAVRPLLHDQDFPLQRAVRDRERQFVAFGKV